MESKSEFLLKGVKSHLETKQCFCSGVTFAAAVI